MMKKLSAREKKLLLFLGALLLVFGFYSYLYQPQVTALAKMKDTLQQKQDQYARLQSLIKEKNSWQRNQAVKKNLSLPDFLAQVSELASKQGVTITSFQPEDKTEGTVKQTILHINLEGDFLSLQAFFFAWERQINDAVLTSLEITPVEGKDQLQATLLVKALFL